MTLTQLRYFQAVCRSQSMTHASEYLRVSQPSLSHTIRELEAEFNVTLFSRQHRRMEPTEEGLQFLELVDGLLLHSDRVEQSMIDIGRKRRQIHLGVPPMIGTLFLPAIYYSYFNNHPETSVQIEEGGRSELIRQLDNGQLDIALLPHDKELDPDYSSIPLTKMETMCCVSRIHPLVNRNSIRMEMLRDEQLVLFKDGFFLTERIKQRLALDGISPKILMYTDQLATLHRLIAMSIGSGFMFDTVTDTFHDIAGIPLDPPMYVDVSLVWKRSGFMFGELLQFINYMRKHSQRNIIKEEWQR